MRLGTGNRWDELTALAAMLAFVAALIAVAMFSGSRRPPEPTGGQPPAPAQTPTPAATAIATLPISTPEPLPVFDDSEQRAITSLSPSDLSVVEPISFRSDAAQEIPAQLCVHWKIFRHNDVTGRVEVIAEFFESCDEAIATTDELLPERFVRLENAALREQLSFIVSQLSWDEYLTISRRYAQARVSKALDARVEGQPPQ